MTTTPSCVHHWGIEPANGPTSLGYCGKCGAVKEFVNHTTEVGLWDMRSDAQARRARKRWDAEGEE